MVGEIQPLRIPTMVDHEPILPTILHLPHRSKRLHNGHRPMHHPRPPPSQDHPHLRRRRQVDGILVTGRAEYHRMDMDHHNYLLRRGLGVLLEGLLSMVGHRVILLLYVCHWGPITVICFLFYPRRREIVSRMRKVVEVIVVESAVSQRKVTFVPINQNSNDARMNQLQKPKMHPRKSKWMNFSSCDVSTSKCKDFQKATLQNLKTM